MKVSVHKKTEVTCRFIWLILPEHEVNTILLKSILSKHSYNRLA